MKDVFIGPENGKLHGVYVAADASGRPGIVVCHPHPQYGGSMDNNVVLGVCAALVEADMNALRFNFRGVGRSSGAGTTDGSGEAEDVRLAVDFLAADSSVGDIFVIGYSYGAAVGLRAAADDDRIAALVGIAPPTSMFDFGFLHGNDKPILLIAGSHDEFCDPDALLPVLKDGVDRLEIIDGADHFFIGEETALGNLAADFLQQNY